MTKSGYMVLKDHFDNLFKIQSPGTGFERIRETYKEGLNFPIGLYDVNSTEISIANNPIRFFTTLVGPDNDEMDIPIGIIPAYDNIHSVNFIDKKYFLGLDEDNVVDYMVTVFDAIENLLKADSMYSIRLSANYPNPYLEFLHILPIYITFNHIREVNYSMIGVLRKHILNWLEKFACDSMDDAKLLFKSMEDNDYYNTFENVYRTVTCDNTIVLFG